MSTVSISLTLSPFSSRLYTSISSLSTTLTNVRCLI
jgi:hypothetical protein